MTVRYRPMRPNDVRECVEIVSKHPVLGARYGDVIQHLSASWLRLLGSDAFVATVFEELRGERYKALGAGIAVFVTDDFVRQLKTRPFWIGPELTIRSARGEKPFLTDKEVRNVNSCGGLNLAVWQTAVLPENLVRLEVGGLIMSAFVEAFRGFLLKESLTQAETVEHVEALRLTGGLLWDKSRGSYCDFSGAYSEELINVPHVIGMTRNLASRNPGSWAASMFLYQPPRFGFSRSEQRLLVAAANGETDQELSDYLGISLATVKKTWRLVYERVAIHLPELIPPSLGGENGSSERGREKKQRLIAYLREHPEELRPISRKLLRQDSPRAARVRP